MIIGCGRVGSAVAKKLAEEGWNVTCVDEDENALARLGAWKGGFVVGHGMDKDILEQAGAVTAHAAVVATDGDNSNIVIGQILQRRYGIGCVVVRVLDPARAEFYTPALGTWSSLTLRTQAVIVALHGMSDYSHAFAMPGAFWAKAGITVYAYDQRGFNDLAQNDDCGGDHGCTTSQPHTSFSDSSTPLCGTSPATISKLTAYVAGV